MNAREYNSIPNFVVSVSSVTYNAKAFQTIYVDTTSNAVTIPFPSAPLDGDEILIIDSKRNSETNNINISGNGKTINGSSNNFVISRNGSFVKAQYISNDWKVSYIDSFKVVTDGNIIATKNNTTKTLTLSINPSIIATTSFSTIAVSGIGNIVSTSNTDTLTLIADKGLTFSIDSTAKTITFKRLIFNEPYSVTSDYSIGQVITIPNARSYTLGTNNLQVFCNRLLLQKDIDYTETSTTSVTFLIPLLTGDSLIFRIG